MCKNAAIIILFSLFYCIIVGAQSAPTLAGSYSGPITGMNTESPCVLCEKYGACPANVSCTSNLLQTSQCLSGQVCLTRQWMLDGLSNCRAIANKAIGSWSSRCGTDLGNCLGRCRLEWWNRWVSCSAQMDQPGYDPDCFLYSNIIQSQCYDQCHANFKSCHAELAVSSARMYSECDKSNPYPQCTTCSGDSDCASGYKCRNGKQQCDMTCSDGPGCCPHDNTQCVKVCNGEQCNPGEVCRKEKKGSVSFTITANNRADGFMSDGTMTGTLSAPSLSLIGTDSDGSPFTASGEARMGFVGTVLDGDGKSNVWFSVCSSGACATEGSHDFAGSYEGIIALTITSDGVVTGTLSAPSGGSGPDSGSGSSGPTDGSGPSGSGPSGSGPGGDGSGPGGDGSGPGGDGGSGPGDGSNGGMGPGDGQGGTDGQGGDGSGGNGGEPPSGGSLSVSGKITGTSLSISGTDPRGKQITITGTGGLGFFGKVVDSDGESLGWAAMCDGGDCLGCSQGQDKCDGVCTDLNTSKANCGECGNVCAQDEFCNNGVCACSSGFKCGTQCVDMYSDPKNCGGCGFACLSGKCSNGNCECTVDQVKCGTSCLGPADMLDDSNNCGGCGSVCLSDQLCSNGTCMNLTQITNGTQIINWTQGLVTGGTGGTSGTGGCYLSYNCSNWTACVLNGTQARNCSYSNTCDTTVRIKKEVQRCNYGCLFDNPKCNKGSICLDNQCIIRECENDSDCVANDSCTSASCSAYKCEYERQSGCSADGSCVPVGTAQVINESHSYCSSDGIWLPQSDKGDACEQNYACLSNNCSEGKCVNAGQVGPVGNTSIFDGIMKFLSGLWKAITGIFG